MFNLLKDLKKQHYVLLVTILILTGVLYIPSLKNDYIKGWDDFGYLFENTDIQSLSLKNIIRIFSSYEMGNYHPLTVLSYAIEYALVGNGEGSAWLYHLNNLLGHVLNTFLVFVFIRMLTKNDFVSFFTSLLFGIHPMHVESVAWISERKDILYTIFFLASAILYMKYKENEEKKKPYYLSLAAFVIACLCKGMAVSLALVIVLMDVLHKRKFDKKLILEKIPYFIIALVFGVISVFAQGKAVQLNIPYTAVEQFQVVNATFFAYLQKLLYPVELCGFYPYPDKPNNILPGYFWLYPAAVLLLFAFSVYSLKFTRKIFFCVGFFVVTIVLVLQIVAVGGASMSDRYTYVPSIGYFLLFGYGIQALAEKNKKKETLVYGLSTLLLLPYFIFLSVQTIVMIRTWKDSIAFFDNILNLHPTIVSMRNNRGNVYLKANKEDLAIKDYEYVAALEPNSFEPYKNIGIAWHQKKEYRKAIFYFNKAISLRDTVADLWNNRASAYATLGINDSAEADFKRALSIKPNYPEAQANYKLLQENMKKSPSTLEELTRMIEKGTNDPDVYCLRGFRYFEKKIYPEAIADFDACLKLKNDHKEGLFNMAMTYANMNNGPKSIEYYTKVIAVDPRYENAFLNRAIEFGKQNKLDIAINDFKQVIVINPNNSEAYYNLGFAYNLTGNKKDACDNFAKAAQLNHAIATNALRDLCK